MIQKINIADIVTEKTHDGTTHRKRLISASETHTGTIATMNYAWLEPDKQLTLHAHSDGEEFYFFFEGSGKMRVGNDWFKVNKGDFVTVFPSQPHSLKNSGTTRLLFITIRTQT